MHFIPKINTTFIIGLFILSLGLYSSSCNTTKEITSLEEEKLEGTDAFLHNLYQNFFQAEWLTANARLSYDDGSMNVGGTASIKMQKDKIVWVSVKKFGFELGRAKITSDSIYILDRINNQFAIEPISYIEDFLQLPADLGMLQQIILGNPVFLTKENAKGGLQNELYQFSAANPTSRNDYWFSMPDYQVQKMEFNEDNNDRSLAIQLENYKDAGGNRDFSYLRKISASTKASSIKMEMEFSNVKIDVPSEIKFSIPPRYTPMKY